MPEEIGCPGVFLASGQKLTLLKVMLYDGDGVQEVAKLRSQAAKSLGGGSLGVGVIGSPSWTLLGEAAAISIIGGLLSSVAQKQAVEMLQTAQSKSEAVAQGGVYVEFTKVTNRQSPHPNVWSASGNFKKRWGNGSEWRRLVHNGDEFVNVETDLGAMSIRWNQVAAYFSGPNEDKSKEEAERHDGEEWSAQFRYTADGELCSEEALNVLRKAKASGYAISTESDGTFLLQKDTSTTYLRTNDQILRIGKILLAQSRKDAL